MQTPNAVEFFRNFTKLALKYPMGIGENQQ